MRGNIGVAALLVVFITGVNLVRRSTQLSSFLSVIENSATSGSLLPESQDTIAGYESRRRILLGIYGVGNNDLTNTRQEGRRRRIIRQTYLKYLGRFNKSYRVCSLSKLLSEKKTTEDCDIVYTFVIANKKDATDLNNVKKSNSKLSKKGENEPDKIFVKVKKPHKLYQITQAWIDAAKKLQDGTTGAQLGHFDYVFTIPTDLMIQPQEFWRENSVLFMTNGTSSLAASHQDNPLLFSIDIANYFADKKPSSLSAGLTEFQHDTGKPISNFTVGGIVQAKGLPVRTLASWDKYINPKAPMLEQDLAESDAVSYANKTHYNGMPRMLFGIFTTDLKPIERERRDTVRSTYLSFYSDSATPHRICSIQQLLRNVVKNEDCQIAYTFVVGSNANGPTQRVGANTTESMEIPPGQLKDPEDDVLYLNIKENMEEGKSDTWFRYGYLLSETTYFDYIAKVDADTLVYPSAFVKDLKRMPTYPWNKRIFGGKYDIRHDYPTKYPIVGPNFMSGHLYWMSPDLAGFITDPERCDRKKYHAPLEDVNIANLVHSHPQMIRRFQMSFSSVDHPVKRIGDFKAKWKKYTKNLKKN